MNTVKSYFTSLIFILFLLISCLKEKGEPIASVGRFTIYKKDIDFKEKLIKYYYPQSEPGKAILSLLKSYSNAAILEKNGILLTSEVLDKENQRIDKNTKDPESLLDIKNLFDGDTESYLKVFVLPVLADRLIYFELYKKVLESDKSTINILKSVKNKVQKNTRSFSIVCKEEGGNYDTEIVHPNLGIVSRDKIRKDKSILNKRTREKKEIIEMLKVIKKEVSEKNRELKILNIEGNSPNKISNYINKNDKWEIYNLSNVKSDSEFNSLLIYEKCMVSKVSFEEFRKSELKSIKINLPSNI